MPAVRGKELPPEKRWAIVEEWKRCHCKATVARLQGVSLPTVDKWVGRYTATGDVGVAPKSGRPRKLSEAAARRAVDLLLDGEQRGANDVALELGKEGLTRGPVHRTTLARGAKQLGRATNKPIHSVSGRPEKQLTMATQGKRLKFAQGNITRSWKSVMFTDRKRFYHRFPGSGFKPTQWVRVGEQRAGYRPNNPSCLNVYLGITQFGATSTVSVAGTTKQKSTFVTKKGNPSKNITHNEYQYVLQKHLLPRGAKIFKTQGTSCWTFQQDNDPSHGKAAQVVAEWNAKHSTSIQLLANWPPNSPDLSPIENFWGWVQAKVDAIAYDTFDEFKAGVEEHISKAPKSLFLKYFQSMKKRVAKVIELEGGKTKY
jgi:hypothetical protein